MCECIEKVNELIVKEKGIRLRSTVNLTTGQSRVAIETEAVAGRKKPRGYHLLPTYCPFCSEKY